VKEFVKFGEFFIEIFHLKMLGILFAIFTAQNYFRLKYFKNAQRGKCFSARKNQQKSFHSSLVAKTCKFLSNA
jgi:hypothetical protein